MKKILAVSLMFLAGLLTACGATRSEGILKACQPSGHVVALDDDQVVCEQGAERQYIKTVDEE